MGCAKYRDAVTMELEDHWEILSGLSNEWHQGEGSEVTLRVTSA